MSSLLSTPSKTSMMELLSEKKRHLKKLLALDCFRKKAPT